MSYSSVIYTQPSIENVIPYELYKNTDPATSLHYPETRLSTNAPSPNSTSRSTPDLDVVIPTNALLPILYGGGRNLILSKFGDSSSSNTEAEVFVLDCGMIVWFKMLQLGVQLQYKDVVYHGVVSSANNVTHTSLLVSIAVSPAISLLWDILGAQPDQNTTGSVQTLDLIFTPVYYEEDRFYNENIENLFQYQWFGLNKGNSMVRNISESLDFCMEHYCTGLFTEENDDDGEYVDNIENNNTLAQKRDSLFEGVLLDTRGQPNNNNNNNSTSYYYNNFGTADDL